MVVALCNSRGYCDFCEIYQKVSQTESHKYQVVTDNLLGNADGPILWPESIRGGVS